MPTCESCGADVDEVVPVRRVWEIPEAWDRPASRTVDTDTERWCFPCRTHYPHELLEDDAPT